MKKILILIIILLAMPFSVFAAKEVAMPLSVSAVKESETYNFEIKNAKDKDAVEIEVKSEGNDAKANLTKNVFVKNNKKIMLNLGVLPFPYVYKSVYGKKEDDTYAKIEGKGVSDSLSQ